MTKLHFPCNMKYGKRLFEKGQTYNIDESLEVSGFVSRWVRRGCTIVEEVETTEEVKDELLSDEDINEILGGDLVEEEKTIDPEEKKEETVKVKKKTTKKKTGKK